MSLKSKVTKIQNKLEHKFALNALAKNEKGSVEMLKASIIAIIALVVIVTLGVAILPGAVTSLSDTGSITNYSTWSTGTKSIWTALAIFVVLVFLMILVAILLGVIS